MYFRDTVYKVVSKTGILVRQDEGKKPKKFKHKFVWSHSLMMSHKYEAFHMTPPPSVTKGCFTYTCMNE